MQILFIFSLVFAILVSIFAVMNSDPVTIKLFWRQFEFSQAIVILGSAAFGAIIVTLLGVFRKVKSSFKIRELQNKVKTLEKELEEMKPKEDLVVEMNHENNFEHNNIESIEDPVIVEDIKIENKDDEQQV